MRILPSLNRFYFIISIFFYFQFVVGFHTKFLDLTKFFGGLNLNIKLKEEKITVFPAVNVDFLDSEKHFH